MKVPELFWDAIKALDHYGALIAALATIAIAGFTWTLKKSTDKLWDASEKQTALSRHALISTEQAFIFCKQMHAVAGVDGKTGKVDEWMFMPVWENSGSTRTKRLFMDSSWRSFSPDMPDDFDFPSWTTVLPQPIMIGPKATTWGGECTIPISILLAANKGECKIYLWGSVEYNDVFEGTPRHRTEYCVEVRVTGNPHLYQDGGQPLVPFIYRGNPRHNGAEDECFHKPKTSSS